MLVARRTTTNHYHCTVGGTRVCCTPSVVDFSLLVARTAMATLPALTRKHATQSNHTQSGAPVVLALGGMATLHCQLPSPSVAASYPEEHSHRGCSPSPSGARLAATLAPGPCIAWQFGANSMPSKQLPPCDWKLESAVLPLHAEPSAHMPITWHMCDRANGQMITGHGARRQYLGALKEL